MTLRAARRDVVDEQAVEGVDLDVRLVREHRRARSRRARRIVNSGDFSAFTRIGDDDAVEQARAARDDVDVAVGQRIERAGIDGESVACVDSAIASGT